MSPCACKGAVAEGARAYWICPLVAESETLDVAAVEERYAALKDMFGGQIGLVHGKMKGVERDAAMAAFARGDIKVLVATTVVEVGVDVPEASIIVIEHAERFGLAQLHQLRGRVGRGQAKSTCLLLYKSPLSETAKARIEIMRETEDGFRIAEEDLRLRGGGDAIRHAAIRPARLPTGASGHSRGPAEACACRGAQYPSHKSENSTANKARRSLCCCTYSSVRRR